MTRFVLLAAVAVAIPVALAFPGGSSGHPERATEFPDPAGGSVPEYRRRGASQVVCKADSHTRLRRAFRRNPRMLRSRLKTLRRCSHEHVQEAVNAAKSGERILIMPGVYKEEPSRAVSIDEPKCANDFETTEGNNPNRRSDDPPSKPTYQYHLKCPNSRNLIAILGDQDGDRACESKCNLQVEGLGRRARDTVLEGDQLKPDVIRADRADGVLFHNFTIQYGEFNNIDVVETDGYRFSKLVTRWAKNYGLLSFASDHGLYESIETYQSGDGGIYPGSAAEGECKRFTVEVRNVNSYLNQLGYSGTAGNSVWVHDSRFHHNAIGVVTDSFATGHPGMPQDCAKWSNNEIYSNNTNYFDDAREARCNAKPFHERDPKFVCPQFQVPVGTGLMIAGGNHNVTEGNYIYDNWRFGTMLYWVPAELRDEFDPAKTYDTSNGNVYRDNHMGVRPDGTRDPNGLDHWWDEEGRANCWTGNRGPQGAKPTSDPATLPSCPGSSALSPGKPDKQASNAPCASWDPKTRSDPPGCAWFELPPEPR